MKMIRNNETGLETPATDQLMKRVLREVSAGEKAKWTVFEKGGTDKPKDKPAPEAEKAPPKEPEKEPETQPEEPEGDGLAEVRAQALAKLEAADKIEEAKKRKDAYANVGLEYFGLHVDKRLGAEKAREEVLAVIEGRATVPPVGEDDD
jgi:hypothetical protein